MFDIGAPELLVIVIVAILVIGPKDMPMALRAAGRWIGKIRRVSGHFRSGIESMIRDAELEEMDRKWQEQNEQIMAAHPGEMLPLDKMSDTGPKPGPGQSQDGIDAAVALRTTQAQQPQVQSPDPGLVPPADGPAPPP